MHMSVCSPWTRCAACAAFGLHGIWPVTDVLPSQKEERQCQEKRWQLETAEATFPAQQRFHCLVAFLLSPLCFSACFPGELKQPAADCLPTKGGCISSTSDPAPELSLSAGSRAQAAWGSTLQGTFDGGSSFQLLSRDTELLNRLFMPQFPQLA